MLAQVVAVVHGPRLDMEAPAAGMWEELNIVEAEGTLGMELEDNIVFGMGNSAEEGSTTIAKVDPGTGTDMCRLAALRIVLWPL